MTAKEDAKRMLVNFKNTLPRMDYHLLESTARDCALLTVEELISEADDDVFTVGRHHKTDKQHWEAVKKELQNL
jgi:hypothetical protein